MAERLIATDDLVAWMRGFARLVEAENAHLSDLDASTGDADHGSNLQRGSAAILAMIDAPGGHGAPGAFLKQVGLVIVDSVGGSSGALYGTIFLRLAATAGADAERIDGPTMARALDAAARGVVDRGRARAGDKTMLDALEPAAQAYAEAITAGRGIAAAWQAASAAAEAGAAGTATMRARRGKSSYVGDKSIGAVDPGAASVALLIAAAAEAMAGL